MGLLDNAARKGRGGDTLLGHLTPGDVVIPAERVTPQIQGLLGQVLGKQLGRFTAGTKGNSINPKTGLPEFEGTDSEGPGAEGPTGASGPGTGQNGTGNGTGGVGSASGGIGDNGFSGSKMTQEQTTPGFMGQMAGFLGKSVINGMVSATGLPGLVAQGISMATTGKTIGDHATNGLAGLMGHDTNDQADAPATGPAESSGGGATSGANTGGSQANGGSNGGGFFNAIAPLLAPSAPPPAPGSGLLGVAPQPQVPHFIWPSFLGPPPPGFLR